jgi:hypothetical protein
VKQEASKNVCHLPFAKFFLGLLADPEDGNDTVVRSVSGPVLYSPEDNTLHSHRCGILKCRSIERMVA